MIIRARALRKKKCLMPQSHVLSPDDRIFCPKNRFLLRQGRASSPWHRAGDTVLELSPHQPFSLPALLIIRVLWAHLFREVSIFLVLVRYCWSESHSVCWSSIVIKCLLSSFSLRDHLLSKFLGWRSCRREALCCWTQALLTASSKAECKGCQKQSYLKP